MQIQRQLRDKKIKINIKWYEDILVVAGSHLILMYNLIFIYQGRIQDLSYESKRGHQPTKIISAKRTSGKPNSIKEICFCKAVNGPLGSATVYDSSGRAKHHPNFYKKFVMND